MTTSDICILKSTEPLTFIENPSKETFEYLAKLSQNSEFSEFIKTTRSQFGITDKGLDIKPYVGQNLYDLPYVSNQFVISALQIVVNDLKGKLGFSDDFIPQLILLVFFNAIVDVKHFEGFITKPIQFILGKKHIASEMFHYPYEVGAILIPFNISQNKLGKWIKDNWATIKKQMDENLTANPYILRMHKNTEIGMEIVEMRDEQKLSFPKITNLLSKKYLEDERTTSEEWVKKIYKDYKEIHGIPPKQD